MWVLPVWSSRSAPAGSSWRCARRRREPHLHATEADERSSPERRGAMSDSERSLPERRAPRAGIPARSERDGSLSRSATSCCSRSTTSSPSGPRGIDDESYAALHDDYTARAAATLRALRTASTPGRRPPRAQRRDAVTAIGGLVAFAVVAASRSRLALGARLPGQTSSGNATVTAERRRIDAARAAVTRRPTTSTPASPRPVLREAAGPADALEQYDAGVSSIRTTPRRTPTSAASLLPRRRAAADAGRAGAAHRRGAAGRLDRAIAADPDYPDAYFFRGVRPFRAMGEPRGRRPTSSATWSLPPADRSREQARGALADVTAARDPVDYRPDRPPDPKRSPHGRPPRPRDRLRRSTARPSPPIAATS